MEKERYSFPKIEDIQKRIDILKANENVDHDLIELLEEMKKASEVQIRVDSDPMEEITDFESIEDIVRNEQDSFIKGIRQTLSKESMQIINREIELNPIIFRSKIS